MAAAKIAFCIDKPFLSCYNLTITGGVAMSRKGEITIHNGSNVLNTTVSSFGGLHSEIAAANNNALDTYRDIIKSPDVPIEIKADFVKMFKSRERTMRSIDMVMAIGGCVTLAVIGVILAVKIRL